MPDQVEAAGGIDILGRAGEPSFRTTWEANTASDPEVVSVLPCGYDLDSTARQASQLWEQAAWRSLLAVVAGRVWAVSAST